MVAPKMTDVDLILKELTDIKGFYDEKLKQGVAPLKEEVDRMVKSYAQVQADLKSLRMERAAKLDDGRMRVPTGRFAGFGFFELRAIETILQRFGMLRLNDSLIRRWMPEVDEARKQLMGYVGAETLLAWEDMNLRKRAIVYPNADMDHFKAFLGRERAVMNQMVVRAMDSTTAAKGDELVPTFESAELWMDVNLATQVLPTLQQVGMPTNPYDIPIQFGDTNWYPITENVAATTSDLATQKVTLTAKGLKTGVPFSDELEEDSIVPFVSELRSSLARNAAEVIDDVVLNADTTVTNNINADGATINTTTAGKAHWLLGFDGLVHAAIVDNSANTSLDKNAVVDADIYNRVLTLMGKYAVSQRRGDVVYVVDVATGLRSLAIAEMETVDVAGARSTLSTGEFAAIYGKPVIMSSQLKLADTDGKVTSAGNATNTGRILCYNSSQWRVGFRRQITMEPDREPGKGQSTLYVSFRIALTERSGTRSTQTHTAIAYDVKNVTA